MLGAELIPAHKHGFERMRLRDLSDYIVYPFGISGLDGVVFHAAPLQIGSVAYWPITTGRLFRDDRR